MIYDISDTLILLDTHSLYINVVPANANANAVCCIHTLYIFTLGFTPLTPSISVQRNILKFQSARRGGGHG